MTKIRRNINGILLLDKPEGISSNAALQQVKRLFQAKKAGHTGSLDPLATGMLPICFGQATKCSQYLLASDKTYLVEAKWGVKTATGDAEGDVIQECAVEGLSMDMVSAVVPAFTGDIDQVPSMYSALKHKGQPLYKYARQGITIERPARRVTIYDLNLLSCGESSSVFKIRCSKGTYIRTLVEDMGDALGFGGHVSSLRRLSAGPYVNESMLTMDQLQACYDERGEQGLDDLLLSINSAFTGFPRIQMSVGLLTHLRCDNPFELANSPESGLFVFADTHGVMHGVGEVLEDGRVVLRRRLSSDKISCSV